MNINGHIQTRGIKQYSEKPVPDKMWGIVKAQISQVIPLDHRDNNSFE